jgi:hypothetical protein
MAVTMRASASGSAQRTGDSSIRARSSMVGSTPEVARSEPIWTMWLSTSTPICWRSSLARVPAATRAAVSRAEARSSTSRASSSPYLSMPDRSAWPGRGLVRTAEGRPGSGDISVSHLGHSVLAISMATGEPRVRP